MKILINVMYFTFSFSISCCENPVLKAWLGLGTKTTGLVLEKEALDYNFRPCHHKEGRKML